MAPEGTMLGETSQTEKDTEWYHLQVDSKKIKQMNENNKTFTDTENKLVVPSEEREVGRARMDWD